MQPDDKTIYKTIGEADLYLHLFRPEAHRSNDRRPGIVFFFGGGWNGGTPSQFYPHCQYLASRGMVAIAAEYRVKSVHGTSPYKCVTDGKSAVRWIRQHAEEMGINPDRIAAGGGSAGGHIAAAAGTLTAFDDPSEDMAISSRPNALVLFNPVFDNGPGGFGHDRVQDRWRDISPLHNIRPGIPPTILFFGSEDRLVPVSTIEKYRTRMIEAGARCDVHIYEDQPHAFFNYRDGNNPYYNQTVIETDKFLTSLGYLEGDPTLRKIPL